MEHRSGERVTVRAPVRLRRIGWDTSGVLVQASLSGGFVRTRLQAPILSFIELELFGVRVAAYVVRAEPQGLALEWFELAPAGVARLLTPLTMIGGSAHSLTASHERLRASTRTLRSATAIGPALSDGGAPSFVRTGSVGPSLGRVRVSVGPELNRDGSSEEIKGLAKDVGEVSPVSVGH